MSDSSLADKHDHQSKQQATNAQAQKRKASAAGLDGSNGPPHGRSVKRRASKACQCCRARKVRCNVTEHGAPCTNCRLDEVECIVSESRRKKSVLPKTHSSFLIERSMRRTVTYIIIAHALLSSTCERVHMSAKLRPQELTTSQEVEQR